MPKISQLPPIGGVGKLTTDKLQNLLVMVNDPGLPAAVTQKVTIGQVVTFITGTAFVYRANLGQVGVANPTETLLHSTIDPIVWTRTGVGLYVGTFGGTFPTNRTFIIINEVRSPPSTVKAYRSGASTIAVETRNAGALTDGLLREQSIEIFIY